MLLLYKLYAIPGAFVSERLHHVACSFGSARGKKEVKYSWFHFLCKNIPVKESNGVKRIVNKHNRDVKDLSQADFSWVRSGYCLISQPSNHTPGASQVTLVIFGGEIALWERFDAFSSTTPWQDVLQDPYCLFQVILEVLYARIDRLAWDLADVYGLEEEKILRSADHPGYAVDGLDFVGLHMLSKHQIYLLEAVDAVTATLESMRMHHERLTKASTSPIPAIQETEANFRYRKMLFKSTDLRLKSLEKRTQNMINLSFNLVTQADSRMMKVDSSSMKTIAVMTLIFLPCTAVATVFGTPFFSIESDSDGSRFLMSPYIWLIWVFAVPLTVITMFTWYRYQRRLEARITLGAQPLPVMDV